MAEMAGQPCRFDPSIRVIKNAFESPFYIDIMIFSSQALEFYLFNWSFFWVVTWCWQVFFKYSDDMV
jgi:hypothetical protein